MVQSGVYGSRRKGVIDIRIRKWEEINAIIPLQLTSVLSPGALYPTSFFFRKG
jgi:hypothetical protein